MATDIPSPPQSLSILREEEFAPPVQSEADSQPWADSWFYRLVIQSGLSIAPSLLLLVCLLAGITVGGGLFVVQENLLTMALGLPLGALLPVGITMVIRHRRQTHILRQMPGMVDELARAARTGRSLEQCFQIVARDTPPPLGNELELAARKLKMGVPLSNALHELPQRTGLVSLQVLVMALTIHHQTGGDLVSVLERLSRTIRDRLLFVGRLRASTAASRATAALMIGLPVVIFAFFVVRDPEYFNSIMASRWGRWSLFLAIALQIVGSVWVIRVLRNSTRT